MGRSIPGAVLLRQFDNPANPAAHERTTGEEIWRDSGGELAAFVAGIGTGGTITGVARLLERRAPSVRIVGVEPKRSAVLGGGEPGHHGIQGIGAGFVPRVLDRSLIDEVVAIDDEAAFDTARWVARNDGLLIGPSSGAALAAASRLAREPAFAGRRLVVVLPDAGERYASSGLLAALD
jgi:cysteine synthase A